MKVQSNGYFSYDIDSGMLSAGLRKEASTSRKAFTMIRAEGVLGEDSELKIFTNLTLSSLTDSVLVIKDDFPFPQVFVLGKHLIVCNRTSILELSGSTLISKIEGLTPGELWSADSSCDFIYFSNGKVSVVRDPLNGQYALSSAPVCSAICNYNGQIICGNLA